MSENEIMQGESAAVLRLERACMAGGWLAAQIQCDDVRDALRLIDRLTAERDDLNALLMSLQDRHREVMAERDAAVADAERLRSFINRALENIDFSRAEGGA